MDKIYACLDLKSFYASVECVERGLDPFTTNLAVADPARGRGAICLAITPAMKQLGIRNRCRLFEIPVHIEYITAKPHMKKYMRYSADIYSIYLQYISREDIHVYSIDECFFDLTPYLKLYGKTAKEVATLLMQAVFKDTGICATAGLGTNLFLAKVALDITAKHTADNIGYLDENEFKKKIWHYQPLTDIWNIGRGIAKRLDKYGVRDLYGVAHLDEKILYREFGVNAEFLIDHAWGVEPCTIQDIHEYKAASSSVTNSQILPHDYNSDDAWLVLKEMADQLILELTDKQVTTNSLSLSLGYARDTIKPAGGTRKLAFRTNLYNKILTELSRYYHDLVNPCYPIRKITLGFNNLLADDYGELDLFADSRAEEKERSVQQTVLAIKNKFGKNALLRGMSLEAKATARERNRLVGGHNGE